MSDYETDVPFWSDTQAALLRRIAAGEQVNAQIDWQHVIEEIEAVGESERRELDGQLARVMEYLMMLQASPATDPRRGWQTSVVDGRSEIEALLDRAPSLRPTLANRIAAITPRVRRAVRQKLRILGETARIDLDHAVYAEDQVCGDWLP